MYPIGTKVQIELTAEIKKRLGIQMDYTHGTVTGEFTNGIAGNFILAKANETTTTIAIPDEFNCVTAA